MMRLMKRHMSVFVVLAMVGLQVQGELPKGLSDELKEKLQKQISLDVAGISFNEAVTRFSIQTKIPVFVDHHALKGAETSRMNISMSEVKAEDALDLLMTEVGDHAIDYEFRKGILYFSTPEKILQRQIVTRMYDARLFVRDIEMEHSINDPKLSEIISATQGGAHSGSLFDDSDEIVDETTLVQQYESLTMLIKKIVRPGKYQGNWEMPDVTMSVLNGKLIIRNTPEVLDKVEEFLNQYQGQLHRSAQVSARLLLIPTKDLDLFLEKETGGKLMLNGEQRKKFLDEFVKGELKRRPQLAGLRTVSPYHRWTTAQSVTEMAFSADLDPVVATGSVAFDPEVAVLEQGLSLNLKPSLHEQGEYIKVSLHASFVTDAEISRVVYLNGMVGEDGGSHRYKESGGGSYEEAKMEDGCGEGVGVKQKGKVVKEKGGVIGRKDVIELPEQRLIQFKTITRIPNGGGVLLTGHHVKVGEGAGAMSLEYVLLLEMTDME